MRQTVRSLRTFCVLTCGFFASTFATTACHAQLWPSSSCDTGNCGIGNSGAGICVSGNCGSGYGANSDESFAQRFRRDYYRNKMWPNPFRAQDAQAVLSIFDAQRNKGWQLHNTIGAAMFEPTSGRLTETGVTHLRWIVAQAPQARRIVFILKANSQQETAARVEQTQLAISQLVPTGTLPQLYLTNQEAPGSSGIYQTSVQRAMTTSVPNPRLGAANQPGSTAP